MDVSSTGKGGGPYTSTMNIVNSTLKNSYNYQLFTYRTELGRFISIKRIIDIVYQLKKIKPDIVHFTGLQLSGFHIAIACRILKIRKTIVVIHGSSTEALYISNLKRKILFIIEAMTLALSFTFYGVSKYSSKLPVTRFFAEKSSGFIYNLTHASQQTRRRILTRKEIGFSNDDILVATAARITKDKGYHILVQSIKLLKTYPKIKFLIIGSGDYLQTMKIELSEQENMRQVTFLGYRDDVQDLLQICDIFTLPTLHETLSMALLEASYCSLPLIASDVGGVPEIISNGINGLLVPPANPIALSEAIRILSEDKDLRIQMGKKAKENIDFNFSEKSIITRIDDLYQSLLRSN